MHDYTLLRLGSKIAENNIKLFLSACCNDFLTGVVWIKAYEQAIIKTDNAMEEYRSRNSICKWAI